MASLPVSNDCQAGVWSRPRAVLSSLLPPWVLVGMLRGVCQPGGRRHGALSSG